MGDAFTIAFDYILEGIAKPVYLTAEITLDQSKAFYTVSRIATLHSCHALPDQHIKKLKDRWVHKDSGLETNLSCALGMAIDRVSGRS